MTVGGFPFTQRLTAIVLCVGVATAAPAWADGFDAEGESEEESTVDLGVSPFDLALAAPEEGIAEVRPSNSNAEAFRQLLRRLENAEERVASLEAARKPQTPEPPDAGVVSSLQQRWMQVRDPSIITVDQQTRRTGARDEPKKWYDRLSIRGYAQFRMNTVLDGDDDGTPAHHAGDRSIGENQSYFIRRARLIFSGDVSEHMYIYLQPDFASSVPGSTDANQFAQIRDWYADLYIDTRKVYRVRVGQSKVPFGWDNLQSSSNRLTLDRSDSTNSAVRNERDLGVFFYYTPEPIQDLFKEVLDDGLKGSGNYGMFGFGVHNGQGGSLQEQNDNVHVVARFAYPFRVFDDQIAEVGLQGYTGKYVVLSSQIRALGAGGPIRPAGTLETGDRLGHRDERLAGTFVWYPKPFGFQAEWNVGKGPALNDAQVAIEERALYGGYAMCMYRHVTPRYGTFFPFVRWNYFRGGYKPERNAPYSQIDELEAGVEWQINDQMELVTQYTVTDRTNTTAFATGRSYEQFEGEVLRVQFQVNY
ncbi:MAG: porin [Planctomycetaceae bacterium]|nr:porin [Planctomycetaceae bacterium]